MPRFFNLQQAERLLPEVESIIRDAIAAKSDYEQAEEEMQNFSRRIMMLGGVLVDHTKVLEHRSRRESSALLLKASMEKIDEIGCIVKDLDIGLLDFPTLLHGEEVYLCWKLGESGIHFWHGVHEGFQGRKAIDREFLANHQGELPN
jgi:hypothetical protein